MNIQDLEMKKNNCNLQLFLWGTLFEKSLERLGKLIWGLELPEYSLSFIFSLNAFYRASP